MYFIEYPKHKLFVCYDGCDSDVNLLFKYNDGEYLLVEYVYENRGLVSAFKKLFELKDKNNSLNLVLCIILDQFDKDSNKNKKREFGFVILPERDRHLKFDKKKYPCIHIFTNDRYNNNTYAGKMITNRLKKKLPIVYLNF